VLTFTPSPFSFNISNYHTQTIGSDINKDGVPVFIILSENSSSWQEMNKWIEH